MLNLWYYIYMLQNPYYLIGTIFVILAAGIAIYAQAKISLSYKRWREVRNRAGITGAQVAREILDANGMSRLPVNEISGELSDNFDPRGGGSVNLSRDIYEGDSIASIAVAAHECGHAIQHHVHYKPIAMRNAIIPFANVGNYLGWFAFIIGLVLGYTKLAWFGFILMMGIVAFQVITLPVEFDASRRGLAILKAHYLEADEYKGAKSMLVAAAFTYVAALLQSLASMLRLLLVLIGNSRDDS